MSNVPTIAPRCPKCGEANNIQTFPMAFSSGTSSGVSHTTGIGVGAIGGSIGVGFGGAQTSTSSMTVTAQIARPPKPKFGCAVMLLATLWAFLALLTFSGVAVTVQALLRGDVLQTVVNAILALIFGVAFVKLMKFDRRRGKKLKLAYEEAIRVWQASWICHRCGHTWQQYESPASDSTGPGDEPGT